MKSLQQHPQADQTHSTAPPTSQARQAQQPSSAATAIAHSPRMTAQRKAIRAAFGPAAVPAQLQVDTGQELSEEVSTPAAATQRAAAGEDMPNPTGMPNQSGVEALSGMHMSGVRVHRNSDKPAQLSALTYARGNDIHLGQKQRLRDPATSPVLPAEKKLLRLSCPWPSDVLQGVFNYNKNKLTSKQLENTQTRISSPQMVVQSIFEIGASAVQLKKSWFQTKPADLLHPRADGEKGDETSPVGIHSRAWLCPSDPVRGTEPISDERENTSPIYNMFPRESHKWISKKKVKKNSSQTGKTRFNDNNKEEVEILTKQHPTACHLLNHDLGGAGISANLFPHNSSYNLQHKEQQEYLVKGKLRHVYQINKDQEKYNRISGKDPLPEVGLYVETRVEGPLEIRSLEDFDNIHFRMYSKVEDEHGNVVKNPYKGIVLDPPVHPAWDHSKTDPGETATKTGISVSTTRTRNDKFKTRTEEPEPAWASHSIYSINEKTKKEEYAQWGKGNGAPRRRDVVVDDQTIAGAPKENGDKDEALEDASDQKETGVYGLMRRGWEAFRGVSSFGSNFVDSIKRAWVR